MYIEKIFELLGDKCSYCGFMDKRTLQVNHIDDTGFRHRKVVVGSTYYKSILDDIIIGNSRNYQLLCANCNWIKRYKD